MARTKDPVETKPPVWWRRPEGRFLLVFAAVLIPSFTVLAWSPVDDSLVVPFTALVARAAGAVLDVLGEEISVRGCQLASPRFAVTIHNGCNGLETILIYVAGVLAFPATWKARLVGIGFGLVSIELINLVRVVSLYYVGVFAPSLFGAAHVWLWQSIVVLAGVLLWLLWVHRCAA